MKIKVLIKVNGDQYIYTEHNKKGLSFEDFVSEFRKLINSGETLSIILDNGSKGLVLPKDSLKNATFILEKILS